jgi:hypothetical protein
LPLWHLIIIQGADFVLDYVDLTQHGSDRLEDLLKFISELPSDREKFLQFTMAVSIDYFRRGASMTDSNKGRELDDRKKAENDALGDQAKAQGESNPTLIANALPNPAPLRVINGGGGFKPVVIPGGKPDPNTKPLPIIDPTLPWEPRTDRIPDPIVPPPSIKKKEPLPEVTVTPAKPLKPIYQPPYEHPVDKVIREMAEKRQRRNKKNQEPGGSPQRRPGGKKKKVTTEEKPFDNNQFHQGKPPTEQPRPENPEAPGKEVSPSEFGRTVNPPAKKTTKRRTPSERNVVTNGPSANTPQTQTPATPPATTPTPAQNPAAPARTPNRTTRRTGQPNSSDQVRTRTQRRTNEQRLADKYTNRKYDNLTQAEKDELRKGYTWSPNNDRPTLRRKDKTSNTPELHLDRNGIIRRGPAPTNNRAPSNSRDMAKNFKETYGEDVPKGDNNHHLTSVKTNNETEITQEAQRLGVRGVDDGSNLIASPSNSDAYNGTVKRTPKEQAAVDKLNANGGRVDVVGHSGSHPDLDTRANELLDNESERLKEKYGVEELKQIPEGNLRKELANSIDKVRNQLRKELVDANKLIKKVQNGQLPKSALQNLPKYIKKYPLRDTKGNAPRQGDPKDYYKISQEPASSQKIAQGPTGEQANKFREVARALKARANGSQMTTYDLGNRPANLLSKKMDTPERLAYFMAQNITTKMKGTDYMKDEFQVAAREKSGEIKVYDPSTYILSAVIDPTKQTISMRPPKKDQADRLEVQRKETLAQAQAKPDPKKRGPERGG